MAGYCSNEIRDVDYFFFFLTNGISRTERCFFFIQSNSIFVQKSLTLPLFIFAAFVVFTGQIISAQYWQHALFLN